MKKTFLLIILSISFFLNAQIQVTTGVSADELVESIIGNGITYSNAVVIGSPIAYGKFENGSSTNLGFNNGIILSNGGANLIIGPNSNGAISADNGNPGDVLLTEISGNQTYDANVLEFDFIPESDSIIIRYTFGSEEYNENVGLSWNDITACFISGPNPNGGVYENENIAVVPNVFPSIPISINNVNNGSANGPSSGPCTNCEFFWDNYSTNTTLEYDGFTTILTGSTKVIPLEEYHVKIAIADGGDAIYDSGVFIEEDSFQCFKEQLSTQHYDIKLDVTDFDTHTISGVTTIQMQGNPNTLSTVELNLIDLMVDSVFQQNVKIEEFTQSDSAVIFSLLQPSDENGNFEVSIHYHGVPFHEGWGGFHWSGEYCFNLGVGFQSIPHNLGRAWFPGIDNFTDRATYDFHIVAENPKKAVCGGTLIDVQNVGDNKKEYHWVIEHPIPTYLASVAVGDYAEINDIYNGIEGDIPIQIFVRPQDSVDVEGTFVNLKSILNIFETHFGPYPWERVGYVGTSIGAMEHVMNIAYPHSAINGNTNYDWWYAHELFHMWFGDNVTCSSAEDMWLNEGWASYSEGFFQEFLYNDRQIMVDYLRNKHFEALHIAHTPNGDGSYFPLNEIPQNVTYGVCAYKKGATVVQSLRGYLGDETFFNAMTDYQSHFQYQSASSHEMEERMTEYTGIDMSHFFENWVYQAGTPHFSIDSFAINQNGTEYLVDVYVKQKRKGSNFLGDDNVMYIDFMDSEWETITDSLHFSGLTGHKQFTIPYFPEMVVSDYGDRIFDARTNYNLTIKNTGLIDFDGCYFKLETDNIEDSTLFRIEHHWVAPDSLQDPVETLRISDYHYWTVNGIFSNNFSATGVFKYSKSNYMDNTLILSDQDSIVLLYRPNADVDWEMISTERIGFWYSGFLYLQNIQKGDYALGVVDINYVGINDFSRKQEDIFQIFPNPVSDTFTLQSNYDGLAKLYSSKGELLSIKNILKKQKVSWDISSLDSGVYFVHFISKNKKIRKVERVNKM